VARLLFERCEEEHSKALDAFHQAGPAGLYVSSMDDAQRWLTLDVNDDREVAFYLYDRRSGETRLLGKDASHTFADKLGRMQPVQYPARDGLTLHGKPSGINAGLRRDWLDWAIAARHPQLRRV